MLGERLLLDTNILVAALAGEIGLVERVARAECRDSALLKACEAIGVDGSNAVRIALSRSGSRVANAQ